MESPDVVNEFTTPQTSSTRPNVLWHTPILSENFVQKEEGKVVESLAEQLRALLILVDVGMDERQHRVNQVRFGKRSGYCSFIVLVEICLF